MGSILDLFVYSQNPSICFSSPGQCKYENHCIFRDLQRCSDWDSHHGMETFRMWLKDIYIFSNVISMFFYICQKSNNVVSKSKFSHLYASFKYMIFKFATAIDLNECLREAAKK